MSAVEVQRAVSRRDRSPPTAWNPIRSAASRSPQRVELDRALRYAFDILGWAPSIVHSRR